MQFNFATRFVATLVLSLAVVIGGGSVCATTYSTDHSDLWWVSSESGWGLQLTQRANVIFATMYVYDTQNNPAWYTATLESVPGSSDWRGDLYLTRGPWYGAPAFDPTAVGYRKVGQMTVSGNAVEQAQLAYSIDGVAVNKTITRQTLRYENFAGNYSGVAKMGFCTASVNLSSIIFYPYLTVTQGANELVVKTKMYVFQNGGTPDCTLTGDYAQFGQYGRSQGTFTCTDGSHGTHTFSEMTVQRVGAHTIASTELNARESSGCTFRGTITGML